MRNILSTIILLPVVALTIGSVAIKSQDLMASASFAVNRANSRQIITAVEAYYIDNGHYPAQASAQGLIEELKQTGYITENFPIDTSEMTYYSQNNGQSYVLTPM